MQIIPHDVRERSAKMVERFSSVCSYDLKSSLVQTDRTFTCFWNGYSKPVPTSHDVLLGIFGGVYYRLRRYFKATKKVRSSYD